METKPAHHIAIAERMNGGVLIEFDSGESAIYSASLLYSVLAKAEPLPDDSPNPNP
jgi:hypothetical protein